MDDEDRAELHFQKKQIESLTRHNLDLQAEVERLTNEVVVLGADKLQMQAALQEIAKCCRDPSYECACIAQRALGGE